MKILLFCFLALLLTAAKPLQTVTADAIVGEWYTEENKSVIKIEERDGKYYGELVWLKEPLNDKGQPKVDSKNPDEKLRNKPIIGLTIVHHLVFDDGEWGDGEVYDPQNGKMYNCKAWLENNNSLKLRGYVGFSLLGRTTTWTRKKSQ